MGTHGVSHTMVLLLMIAFYTMVFLLISKWLLSSSWSYYLMIAFHSWFHECTSWLTSLSVASPDLLKTERIEITQSWCPIIHAFCFWVPYFTIFFFSSSNSANLCSEPTTRLFSLKPKHNTLVLHCVYPHWGWLGVPRPPRESSLEATLQCYDANIQLFCLSVETQMCVLNMYWAILVQYFIWCEQYTSVVFSEGDGKEKHNIVSKAAFKNIWELPKEGAAFCQARSLI